MVPLAALRLPGLPAEWPPWLQVVVYAVGAIALAAVVSSTLAFVVQKALRAEAHTVKGPRRPLTLLLLSFVIGVVLPQVEMPPGLREALDQANAILAVFSAVWLVLSVLRTVRLVILSRYRLDVRDNRHARRVHTMLRVIGRVIATAVVVIGAGAALMTFPAAREFGTSLLASAGIAGLVVGLAARPAIENVIAGIQLAMTEPITLDDVVVMQGEWGRIEEISSTYVVVRIWDDRRLIVPFSWILQNPFTNWTRRTSEILGTVFLHVDYTVPVDEVRAELQRIVEKSEHWDQRVCGLQVTDATPTTLELRAVLSAADASHGWDLRCEVREGLVRWLGEHHPDALPRVRATVGNLEPAADAGGAVSRA